MWRTPLQTIGKHHPFERMRDLFLTRTDISLPNSFSGYLEQCDLSQPSLIKKCRTAVSMLHIRRAGKPNGPRRTNLLKEELVERSDGQVILLFTQRHEFQRRIELRSLQLDRLLHGRRCHQRASWKAPWRETESIQKVISEKLWKYQMP